MAAMATAGKRPSSVALEQEWLLLGVYEHEDEGEVNWAIKLWVDEPQ
jgi:hypothetical protein